MKALIPGILLLVCGCGSEVDTDVSHLIQQSNQAFQERDYHSALALADSALVLNKNSSDAHFMRGRIYFELQQWENAETAYLAVINLTPDYRGVRHNLGNIYFGQRQFQNALNEFIQATQNHPTPMSWHATGGAYNALGQPDRAAVAFRKAIELDSLYGPAHSSLADLHEQQGNYFESLKRNEIALNLQPNHFPNQLRQARLLLRLDQIDKTVALVRHLITEHPYHAEPRHILGQALARLGLSAESSRLTTEAESLRVIIQKEGQLANVVENQPTNFQAQIHYATALRRSGNLEKAMTRYLIAQALRPDNVDLQFHIATLEIDLDDLERAEERLTRILNADSNYVLAWLGLGQIYTKTDRLTLAENAVKQAVQLNPDHPAIRQFLEQP
ncbi:MAG: tetratricopeptide repeat protein [Bacteroidetes bacterium]|nr:tetratricopeptide repeat protein [Bacteroidota bacterium]MCY4205862.1 tetratricopeptide repeat protein [Bacteroidota bacterium]